MWGKRLREEEGTNTWLNGGDSRKRHWALCWVWDPFLEGVKCRLFGGPAPSSPCPHHRSVAGPFFAQVRAQPLSCVHLQATFTDFLWS